MREYRGRIDPDRQTGSIIPDFPEHLVLPHLQNTWRDTASAVVGTWIGLIYQITNIDRHQPFMAEVDANNPLGL
jgi:homoserine O-succinyltransferase